TDGRPRISRRPKRSGATSGSARSTSDPRSRFETTSASTGSVSRATTRMRIPHGPIRSRTRRPRSPTCRPMSFARSRGRTHPSSSATPCPKCCSNREPRPRHPEGALMYTDDAVSADDAGAAADGDQLSEVFSQQCADDPHPVYHDMHDRCPVSRDPGMFGGYSVTLSRYDDVLWALKHPEIFSSKDVVKIGNDVPLIPLSVDPPDHAKYRRPLDPQFSPKRMGDL